MHDICPVGLAQGDGQVWFWGTFVAGGPLTAIDFARPRTLCSERICGAEKEILLSRSDITSFMQVACKTLGQKTLSWGTSMQEFPPMITLLMRYTRGVGNSRHAQPTNASCRVSILPKPKGSRFSAPMAAAYRSSAHPLQSSSTCCLHTPCQTQSCGSGGEEAGMCSIR